MKRQCATCPLRADERGRYTDDELARKVIVRCMTEASQICHHPRLRGKRETHLCRGARNFQLQLFYRLGFLKEPTDDAWNEKVEEIYAHNTTRSPRRSNKSSSGNAQRV